jgi:hypothetical protein
LLDGFATRTSPARSFANTILLNSFLVDSRQLSRGGERAQCPRAYSRALLATTLELLRVAGLSETAARLNLHLVPFATNEARIVCALLEAPRPEKPEPDFASRLSAETDSPPIMTAAEESE